MKPGHIPVLEKEAIEALQVRPEGTYIDCNLGQGGHANSILKAVCPRPSLLGIDLDFEAVKASRERLKQYNSQPVLIQGNFAHVDIYARDHGFLEADGVLFDLGLSSVQLENGYRGFSFRRNAQLDMRFDTAQDLTAYQVVNEYSERKISDIIFELGEEPKARHIARAIVSKRPVKTTTELAYLIEGIVRKSGYSKIHSATKTFQAIRMAVNSEIDNLKCGLEKSMNVLKPGGRMVVISYHSLEDRLVKRIFQKESTDCICPVKSIECICSHKSSMKIINRRVIKPEPSEIKNNPRSRSARMRIAERI
jgi:16S rRNA (cytosine1402-N4)-methyltransferase